MLFTIRIIPYFKTLTDLYITKVDIEKVFLEKEEDDQVGMFHVGWVSLE